MFPTNPVILPPSFTSTTPSETFSDPACGILTWHTLLSQPTTQTSDLIAGIAVCPAKTGHLCPHRHTQAEIYYILQGRGEVTIDGIIHQVTKGSTVYIPSNAEHGVVNIDESTELRWLYVFPTSSFADVVYRFSKDDQAEM